MLEGGSGGMGVVLGMVGPGVVHGKGQSWCLLRGGVLCPRGPTSPQCGCVFFLFGLFN